jgi:hypothetical protein
MSQQQVVNETCFKNVPCNEDENEDEEANDEADDDDGHDVAVDQRLQDVVQRLNLGIVIVI